MMELKPSSIYINDYGIVGSSFRLKRSVMEKSIWTNSSTEYFHSEERRIFNRWLHALIFHGFEMGKLTISVVSLLKDSSLRSEWQTGEYCNSEFIQHPSH